MHDLPKIKSNGWSEKKRGLTNLEKNKVFIHISIAIPGVDLDE